MGDSYSLPLEFYRNTITMAKEIQRLTSISLPTQQLCSVQPCIPTLCLSSPPNLIGILDQDGVPTEISRRLNSSFMKIAEELKEYSVAQYHQACAKLAGLPRRDGVLLPSRLFDQLRKTFATMYDRCIEAWVVKVRKMLKIRVDALCPVDDRSTPKHDPIELKGKGGRFNADYIPTLETYYEKEKFPSRADKEFLATKSGMTYRQIHIWFQNRRNRDRKIRTCGGKEEQAAVKRLEPRSAKVTSRASTASLSRASSVTLVDEYQPFDCCSPTYAYPTTYPPAVEDGQDPFPCRFGDFSFFAKPCWSRRPTSIRQDCREETDLDSLTASFSQLQIGDGVKQKVDEASCGTPQGSRTSSGAGCDITSPYTVRPLRAPLASLIRNCATLGEPCSGKSSDAARAPRHQVVAAPVVANGVHSSRKPKRRQRHASSGVVSENQNVVPAEYPQIKTTAFSSLNPSASSTPQPPKTRRSRKKLASSRHTATASVSGAVQEDGKRLLGVTEYPSESLISHASPTASVDSLPSLSFSSASSSASECSRSPTPSFTTLSDGDDLASIDTCHPGISSSKTQSSQTVWDNFSSPLFATSGFSFDFGKGPMDNLGLELPAYPSYSNSLSSMPPGLQSSPEFAPQSLTFNSPHFVD